ncbi:Kelch repeat-containing protein [Sorangium sp. So ce1151]|uniref:Kelch repeat-containing protein n=1 Tax=Sorangium sp. So ce1151 TaxID=3133332 RepID=UPI003F63EAB7
MHVRIRNQRLLFVWFTWLTSLLAGAFSLLGLGCAHDSSPASGDELRFRFPEQAAQVLEGSDAFVAVEGGFTIASTGDPGRAFAALLERRGGLHASLPERGDGEVRFHLPGGFEVGVREIGAEGEGAVVERAVAYRRQDGTSFWSAVDAGYEEWLLLDAGVANGGAPAAEWEVRGAALRQDGDAVEVADADGAARLRVTAPAAYASGGRPVPVRLEVRGARIALWIDAGGEEVLVDPIWAPTPNMSATRASHTATELANGKVLIVGGHGSGYLASAELYDPAMNAWGSAGTMTAAREDHTATRLLDGRVLVVGGQSGSSTYLATAELYNPANNTWASAGTMGTTRSNHTATLLSSGQVLIVGGDAGSSTYRASAQRYNPANNTWASAGNMGTQRSNHTATPLPNGNVLVVGGLNGVGVLGSVDIYDAVNNTWLPSPAAAAMGVTRQEHTATQLLDGRVLVAGGTNGSGATNTVEIFNPGSSDWTAVSPMGDARHWHTATLLNDGKVLVAGGLGPGSTFGYSSAEVFDPASNIWEAVEDAMSTIRVSHTATLLSTGKVLIAGGFEFTGLSFLEKSSAELYDSKGKKWTRLSPMAHTRPAPTVTRLADGRVLATGGALGDTSAAVYDPTTDAWTATGSMTVDRVGHTATLLGNAKVLVVGTSASPTAANAELFDPATNTWTTVGALSAPAQKRFEHTATRLLDGKVLITGGIQAGTTPATYLKTTGVFDPATNSWFARSDMSVERASHVAVLLQNGKVLVAGGKNVTSFAMGTAEIFDPGTNSWTPAASMPANRSDFDAVLLNNGKVLVVGSNSHPSVYDPGSDSWTALTSQVGTRFDHTLTKLNNGMVLLAGGRMNGTPTATSFLYDPVSNNCTLIADMNYARNGHGSVLLLDGRVLAVGGRDSGGAAVSRPEYYTP